MQTTEIQNRINDKINTHEVLIQVLEVIRCCEQLKSIHLERIAPDSYYRNFPDLVAKYKYKVEIYDMCLIRLNERYQKLLKTLIND